MTVNSSDYVPFKLLDDVEVLCGPDRCNIGFIHSIQTFTNGTVVYYVRFAGRRLEPFFAPNLRLVRDMKPEKMVFT